MKKGFTLVEMLGVFMLLAIIGVIAIPSIMKLRDEYEYDTFKESAKGVLTAAETFHAENDSENFPVGGLRIDDTRLNIKNKDQFEDGLIIYDENTQKFELQLLTNGNYCASGSKDNLVITEGNCETDVACFEFENNTITKYNFDNEACPKVVKIPETINGNHVKAIGPYAFVEIKEGKYCSSDNFANKTYRDYSYNESSNEICIFESIIEGNIYDSNLQTVIFPKTLETIERNAFMGSNIKLLNLKKATKLSSIGNAAFLGTLNLKNVYVPENSTALTTIGNYAFNSSSIEFIDLSKLPNLTTIGDNAFSNTLLTKIDLSNATNLLTIGPYAFYKIQSDSIELNLGDKDNVQSLGISSFCETNYKMLGTYSFSSSISVDNLSSACIN